MADNKDARLTLLNQGPWGVLVTDWTFRSEPPPVDLSLLLAHTIYGRLETELTSLIVLFYFRYHNNIRLLRIRGKLN